MSGSLDILLFDNFIYLLILARDSWACQVTTTKSFQALTVLLDLQLSLLVQYMWLLNRLACAFVLGFHNYTFDILYLHSIP
jgi:hypothetical protein